MQFGMPSLIENEDLKENISLCHELNLDFVELNMNLPIVLSIFEDDNEQMRNEILKLANQFGIYFTIHLDENLNVCDFNKAVGRAYLDTVKRTIQVAKKLRVPIINMHMNNGVYFTLPDQKVYLFEKYNDIYIEHVTKFRAMCEEEIAEADIKISIENTDGYFDFQKNAIDYLLQSDIFTLTWDIGHSHTCKDIDVPFMMQHENKLKHFHIHDARDKKNHLTLGTGEIALEERLSIAKRNNCRCVLETKTIEALRNSVEWLEQYWYNKEDINERRYYGRDML